MTDSNAAIRAALGDKTAIEKIAILSNQDWPLARANMAATLDMIHEIAVAAIYPASPVAGGDLRAVLAYLDERGAPTHWDVSDGHRHPMSITERIAALNQPAAPVEAVERMEASALRIAWWNDMRSRGVMQEDAIAKIKAALAHPPEPAASTVAQGEGA